MDTVRPVTRESPGTGMRATPIGRVAYRVTFGVLAGLGLGCWALGWECLDMVAAGRSSPEGMATFSGQIVWILTLPAVLLLWAALLGFEIAAGSRRHAIVTLIVGALLLSAQVWAYLAVVRWSTG